MLSDLIKTLAALFTPASVKPEEISVGYDPQHRTYVTVKAADGGMQVRELPQPLSPVFRRNHNFHDVESFAAYIRKHFTDGQAVEVLVGANSVVAVDGISRELHQVRCTMPKHPDLKAWEAIFEKGYMTQVTMYRELAAVAHTLFKSSENAVTLLAQLAELKITEGGENNLTLTDHGMYKLRSTSASTTLNSTLDSLVTVELPIYLDDQVTRRFGVRVFIDNEAGQFKLALKPVDLEVVTRSAYVAKVERLRELLGENYLVSMGDIAFGA